jgi:hypothetical protein
MTSKELLQDIQQLALENPSLLDFLMKKYVLRRKAKELLNKVNEKMRNMPRGAIFQVLEKIKEEDERR